MIPRDEDGFGMTCYVEPGEFHVFGPCVESVVVVVVAGAWSAELVIHGVI